MRVLTRAAVLTLGIAAALTVAAPPISANTSAPRSDAVETIEDLADGRRAVGHLPGDFPRIMGYRPELATLSDGSVRVVNPRGSCSVPGEGHPFDFTVACQAHDFGYDMLRYAARTHSPLPADAREQIDNRLTADLHTQCVSGSIRTTCDAAVAIFRAGVGFNSWRQVYEAPVYEAGLPRTAGLALLGGVGLFGLIPLRRRRLLGAKSGSGHRGYTRR